MRPKLGHVLTAQQSAKVAQKDKQRRLGLPCAAKTHWLPLYILHKHLA